MRAVLQLFWPHFAKESRLELIGHTLNEFEDRDLISGTNWSAETAIALEQARLLVAAETDRKRAAETKASIYLAVIAAIIPVLSSLLTDFFADDLGKLPTTFQVLAIVLFVAGMMYLVASGIWSFKTLSVSAHTRVDATDLAKIWKAGNAPAGLVRELLTATRSNRDAVNRKVGYIKIAHEFLLRTYLSFAALILLIVLKQPVNLMLTKFWPWLGRVWNVATN